jgi:hypothetical protein
LREEDEKYIPLQLCGIGMTDPGGSFMSIGGPKAHVTLGMNVGASTTSRLCGWCETEGRRS